MGSSIPAGNCSLETEKVQRSTKNQNEKADQESTSLNLHAQDFPELCEEKVVASSLKTKQSKNNRLSLDNEESASVEKSSKDISSHDANFYVLANNKSGSCTHLGSRDRAKKFSSTGSAETKKGFQEPIHSGTTLVNSDEISEPKTRTLPTRDNKLFKDRPNICQTKTPAREQMSTRTRRIPKVYTPNSNESKVYCFC